MRTYDINDSTEASSGRPLSDLRNFSRFGACPFCGTAMTASLLQAARDVSVGICRTVAGVVFSGIVLAPELGWGFLCCRLIKNVACRKDEISFQGAQVSQSGPRAPQKFGGAEMTALSSSPSHAESAMWWWGGGREVRQSHEYRRLSGPDTIKVLIH